MKRQEAHKLLYEDAFKCELLNFSIAEWEDKVDNSETLNEAKKIAHPKAFNAIIKFIWREK